MDNNDNNYDNYEDNDKTIYMKLVKYMLLNKLSYDIKKKLKKKQKKKEI